MKKMWILLLVITCSYTACHWDYHLSNHLFKKYCNDKDKVGLFIYEEVPLRDEYFMPFPKDVDRRDLDPRFIIADNLMINRERFEQDFTLEVYKDVLLSNIGPINAVETSVTRVSDHTLLGKAVSLKNGKGWWFRDIQSFGQRSVDTCPTGRDEKGFSNYRYAHKALIKRIFTHKIQGE